MYSGQALAAATYRPYMLVNLVAAADTSIVRVEAERPVAAMRQRGLVHKDLQWAWATERRAAA
jgi:hypothetical protein